MIVLDASTALDLVLARGAHERIRSRLAPPESLHAPHLVDLEVLSALRRSVLRGQLQAERAREAFDDFGDLAITRYPHNSLGERIWELRENYSPFDAAYIALAEALDAPLITSDGALARAPGTRARVELYALALRRPLPSGGRMADNAARGRGGERPRRRGKRIAALNGTHA